MTPQPFSLRKEMAKPCPSATFCMVGLYSIRTPLALWDKGLVRTANQKQIMLKEITLKGRNVTQTAAPKENRTGAQVAFAGHLQRKITVILADDHTIVREGLRMILECTEDIEVVGEAENGRLAVQKVSDLKPDVILMDLSMPNLNGVEATRQILKESPDTKVLILSTYSDDVRLLQLLNEGIAGYLVKQSAAHELPKAIREAKKGNAFFSS